MRLFLVLAIGFLATVVAREYVQKSRSSNSSESGRWWRRSGGLMGNYGARINKIHHTPSAGFYQAPYLPTTNEPLDTTQSTTSTSTISSTSTSTTTSTTTTTTVPPETTTLLEETTTIEISEEITTETSPSPTTTTDPFDPFDMEEVHPTPLKDSVREQIFWKIPPPAMCPSELDTNLSTNLPLFWPETLASQMAFPNRPCLTSDMLFVTRECLREGTKVFWGKPNGTCDSNALTPSTAVLYNFANKETVTAANVASVTRKLADTLGQSRKAPSTADVFLVDNVLGQISEHSHNLNADSLSDVATVLDKVSASTQGNDLGRESRAGNMQVATNSILKNVDTILSKIQLDRSGIAVAHSSQSSLMAADLAKSGIKGMQITNSKIAPLNKNEASSASSAEFLQFSSGRASFVLLSNNSGFFKDNAEGQSLNSEVLGVSLDGQQPWSPHGQAVVRLKFKPAMKLQGREVKCAYWDIYHSKWKTDGCRFVGREADLDVCECNHLTHFGEIIGVSGDSKVLDIISIVGSSLSLIGLLGIAATAVVFQHWRSRLGNKILLNLSAAIGLTMAAFLSIALDAGSASEGSCIALGVILHYSILASFCWMLVSASLQFLRFVEVLSSRPPHFLLKGALFSWGLPTIPIIVLLAMGPAKSYPHTNSSSGFCYPVELSLILAVIIPVACIVIGNLLVFCLIIYRVTCGRPKNLSISTEAERHVMAMRQLRMSILLFFLLGLTWIFGLLAMVAPFVAAWRVTFSYLFCTTATLQGLALFLFFIVWEKKTRQLWLTTLPERFVPARPSRPTTSSTAFSDSSSQATSRARDEIAPLRQRASDLSEQEIRRNITMNRSTNGSSRPRK
ncbi:adhesion G-protein coupled receptor G6-like [Neocloeon triangulifer]|uniref:adhesion G-protein coupled receptor G6-like n=1 Tax=Neocloeon triangulifer TaxID=2078957 RepID=UPI00286F8063|nr:adhesion G-protein coupled receptor G6-like [Neocloeon triangulifer]